LNYFPDFLNIFQKQQNFSLKSMKKTAVLCFSGLI